MKYAYGDYVKVAFEGKAGLPGEWMWVKVERCDDERQLLFGKLDNEPITTSEVELGEELAVSYAKVVEHRKAREVRSV